VVGVAYVTGGNNTSQGAATDSEGTAIVPDN